MTRTYSIVCRTHATLARALENERGGETACAGLCFQGLHKKYDATKAATFLSPYGKRLPAKFSQPAVKILLL